MTPSSPDVLQIRRRPQLTDATLVLAFDGWMDGGEVSTGTVDRLVDLLAAEAIAEIDREPFYLLNFPGSMELAAIFRPHIEIKDGLVQSIDMPTNTFYCHDPANLALFIGKEPNLRWDEFGNCIFRFAHAAGVRRILFVGSFGGSVPHTREPRMYVACSDKKLLPEMQKYGVRRTGYEGPGSFTTYLLTKAPAANLEMTSLVAEIPGYLHGRNPRCIEAMTRRLAKILKLPLELDELRSTSTEWEIHVSSLIEQDAELAEKVRQLEQQYDDELLEAEVDGE